MRRPLSKKRVTEIAAGYSAVHDVETVPLAQEVLRVRDNRVVLEVANERARQDEIWGGQDHDDEHNTSDFVDFIRDRLAVVDGAVDSKIKRRKLVHVAALAVAAIQSLDRKARR